MSLYEELRHFADSFGLVALLILFLGLCLWVFRPRAKQQSQEAARLIFEDEESRESQDGQ